MAEIFVRDAFLKGLYDSFPNLEILIFLKENSDIFLKKVKILSKSIFSEKKNLLFTIVYNMRKDDTRHTSESVFTFRVKYIRKSIGFTPKILKIYFCQVLGWNLLSKASNLNFALGLALGTCMGNMEK
jgi:hypothetical protein